jgi:hypothetical protein
MKILVAFERSGVVREAFRRRGHDAWSCDLAPPQDGSPHHIQGDAIAAIGGRELRRWDLVIAHPPCTRLCLSGVLRLYRDGKKANGRDPVKWAEMLAAARLFRAVFDAHYDFLCVENPRQHGHAIAAHGCGAHDQTIQPHQFGEDASKATCLWLRGLPLLQPTHVQGDDFFARRAVAPRMVGGLPRWSNQTDSGQNKLPPSEDRAILRAKTYSGIAEAMAEQWGCL